MSALEVYVEIVSFTVHGAPAPQGSKVVRSHGGRSWTTESSKALPEWRKAVRQRAGDAMQGAPAYDGPVILDVRFFLPRPQGHYGTGRNAGQRRAGAPILPAVQPDLDKLVRAVGDALAGVVIRNDSAVVSIRADKRYADTRGVGVDVLVRAL